MSNIHVESMVGSKDGRGYVSIAWGGERGILTPGEATELATNLTRCAEAAEQDATFLAFLRDKLEMQLEAAASVVRDLRQFRDPGRQEQVHKENGGR